MNILTAIAFGVLTFINFNYCNISGFALYYNTDWFPKLLFVCNHSTLLSLITGGIIFIISLFIIYLNKRVDK